MENNNPGSSVMESEDIDYETFYIITEEELTNSFNLENHDQEIIIDGSFQVTGKHSYDPEGQNIQFKDKENTLDGNKVILVITDKDSNNSDTVHNCENITGQLTSNDYNQLSTNENSLVDSNQPAVINQNQSILLNPDSSAVKDSENSLILMPDQNSLLPHDQKKTTDCFQTILSENSITECEPDVKLLLTDWQKLTCPYCIKQFSKLYHMKAHMVSIHKFPVCEAPFPCLYCNILFVQKDLLLEHCEIEHKHLKHTSLAVTKRSASLSKFTCLICEKSLQNLSYLKKHIQAIHKLPKSDDPFLCLHCLEAFQQENLLVTHYTVEHKLQYWSALEMTKMYSDDPNRYTCVDCQKTFTELFSLKKHMVMDHKYEAPFPCLYCEESFLEENLLLIHHEVKHQLLQAAVDSAERNSNDPNIYACPKCRKTFTEEYLMRKHMATDHKSEPPFPCLICKESFQEENLLLTHYEVTHKQFPDQQFPLKTKNTDILPPDVSPVIEPATCRSNVSRIKCIECNITFPQMRHLRLHLSQVHKLDVSEKEIRFPTMTAFKKWKSDIERRDNTFFTCQSGGKKLVHYISRQYCCHRSGFRSRVEKKSKVRKLLGSSKLGFFCTATMSVFEYPHEVCVKYCLQHYGHGGGTTFVQLSQLDDAEKAAVEENISHGIPLEEQLKDIKDTQSSAEHFQANIMKQRDISFLDRAYASEVYYAGMSALEYVEQWVSMCSEMEDSPILLYRHEGFETKSEDLILVIMTEFQKHILLTSSKQVVCLAYPFRREKGHNLLTALIVIDDQEVAFPVAFCISNKVNKSTMLEFLSTVKESTGPLSFSYFMSNDDKCFYEAWQEVMQDESKWVWSAWSIMDRMRRHLYDKRTKIKDIDTREATYRLVRKLVECNSQPVFVTMFKNFKTSVLDNPLTKNFGKYFLSVYDSHPEMWASCYRKDLKLRSNIFIEFLCRTLYYCLKITQTRKLDKFLMVLMKWLRYKMLDRLSNMLDEEKINLSKNTISMCHNMGLEIECENIISLSDKIWLIQTQNESVYVTREFESCSESCDLRCSDCDVCVHMYSCSCVNSLIHANMCQHIHAVVWKFLTPHFSPPVSPAPDPCDDIEDVTADVHAVADKEPDLLESILKRMQGIYKQVRMNKCKLHKDSLSEVLRLLNRCYQICSGAEDNPHLLQKSTQTDAKPFRSSDRALKDLDNTLLNTNQERHKRTSSIPVMAFDTASLPPSKPSLEDSMDNVASYSEKLKNLDTLITEVPLNTGLKTSISGSSLERYQSDPLRKVTSFLTKSTAMHKKVQFVPASQEISASLECFLRNKPNCAVLKGEGINFINAISRKKGSNKISVIPIIPSNTVPNSKSDYRPVAKKRHIERASVDDVPLMNNSSNVSDSLRTSSLLRESALSSSNNLPVVSFNSAPQTYSLRNPTSVSASAIKNHSEINTNSSSQTFYIAVPDTSVKSKSVSQTSWVVKPTAVSIPSLKKNSEVNTKKMFFIGVSDASIKTTSSSVQQEPSVVKSTGVSVSTSEKNYDLQINSTAQIPCNGSSNTSVSTVPKKILPKPSVVKSNGVSVSKSEKNSDLQTNSTVRIPHNVSPNTSVSTVPNSILLEPSVVKSNGVSVSTSDKLSEEQTNSTNQLSCFVLPNSIITIPNSIWQEPSAVKSNSAPVFTPEKLSNVQKNSTNQLSCFVLPNSVITVPNSTVQKPSVVKSNSVPVSTSAKHFKMQTNSTNQLSYVMFPNTSGNIFSNSVAQTSSVVKSFAKPISTSKNQSEVKTSFSSQICNVSKPDDSIKTLANYLSQTPPPVTPAPSTPLTILNDDSNVAKHSSCEIFYVGVPGASISSRSNAIPQTTSVAKPTSLPLFILNDNSNLKSDSCSEIFYVAVPDASVNSGSNSVLQTSSVLEPASVPLIILNDNSELKNNSSSEIFYVAVPDASVNTVSNSVSQTSSVAKPTSLPLFILTNNSDSKNVVTEAPAISSNKSLDKSGKTRRIPILPWNSVPNSVSDSIPASKRCRFEKNNSIGEPLRNDSITSFSGTLTHSNLVVKATVSSSGSVPAVCVNSAPNSISLASSSVSTTSKGSTTSSSGPLTYSPLIVKATVSSSSSVPTAYVNSPSNSVSQISSIIVPSTTSVSATIDDCVVTTHLVDKVSCFEKMTDKTSNLSNLQFDTSSSVKSFKGESDSSKPTYDLATSSITEMSDAVKSSQPPSYPVKSSSLLEKSKTAHRHISTVKPLSGHKKTSTSEKDATQQPYCSIKTASDHKTTLASEKSDATLQPHSSVKPSSSHETDSASEKSNAVKSSESSILASNSQSGSLQFMCEPVAKKRFVVKAKIPFTPR